MVDPTISKAMIHDLGYEKIKRYKERAGVQYKEYPSRLTAADHQLKYPPAFAAWIPE